MPEDQEIIPIIYCNSVHLNMSLHDFAMVLGVNEPPTEIITPGKEIKPQLRPFAKVIMSPSHFKKFIEIGAQLLTDYEANYGAIPTGELQPKKSIEKVKKSK